MNTMRTSSDELTQLLFAWHKGDRAALDRLMPLIYDELRGIAHRYVKRRPQGQTIETTGLVHEVYLRFARRNPADWKDRSHFFAVCAQVMRNLLIDQARVRQSIKRGGELTQVELDEAAAVDRSLDEQLLALHAALERLAEIDLRKSRIVEMRYFGGMTMEEIALALSLSEITIKREWLKAKAWLYREIGPGASPIRREQPLAR
jgi:RNA polymerase sigma factor (TIGR02999 family)